MTARLEFTRKTKEARFAFSGGICEVVWHGKRCCMPIGPGNVEYHHEKEAADRGDNSFENCRAVCIACHKILTAIFQKAKAKAERQRANQLNSKPPSPRGFRKQPKVKQPSRHIHEPPRKRLYIDDERTAS